MDTLDVYQDMIVLLKQQLSEAQAREQAALEREKIARTREDLLFTMLQDMQHRYDRILEAPRPAPTPQTHASAAVSALRPDVAPVEEALPSRSTVRQRILAVLQEHPEGLTAAEVRVLLQADRSLTDTCIGMIRDGLLRRVGRGRYTVAE